MSRKKQNRKNTARNTAQQQPPTQQAFHHQQVQMPAILTPTVVQKFNDENIKELVDGFNRHAAYQNETDRLTAKLHYANQNKSHRRNLIYGGSVLAITISAAYYTGLLSQWLIMGITMVVVLPILAPATVNEISKLIITMARAFKKDK